MDIGDVWNLCMCEVKWEMPQPWFYMSCLRVFFFFKWLILNFTSWHTTLSASKTSRWVDDKTKRSPWKQDLRYGHCGDKARGKHRGRDRERWRDRRGKSYVEWVRMKPARYWRKSVTEAECENRWSRKKSPPRCSLRSWGIIWLHYLGNRTLRKENRTCRG